MTISKFLLILLLVGSIFLAVKATINFKGKVNSAKSRERSDTKKMSQKLQNGLNPILLPHPDTAFLIEFVSDNCDMCDQMRPVVERLEDDLGTKVRRINIQRRNEFIALLETIGFDEGGNFPFYYNRRSGQAICGATTYMNLRRWGTGNLNHLFNDPPQTLQSQIEESSTKRREIGSKGILMEKLMNLQRSGKDKAKQNTNKSADIDDKKNKKKASVTINKAS